ncbi:EamA family transporter [Celerinatantimonas sp. YJH-8]|uniref:EamA family transporter n=1 Tax=Celerinatantimonas sp. YJH-8 TaxID=3228714 RepID=UPI0038C49DC7
MLLLIIVTILWAFSFSLIGVYLAGQVDAWFSVLIRLLLAALVFAPFIRLKMINIKLAIQLIFVGMVQLGLMYGFYYRSFLYITVPEILLFTVLTPVYITLINDLLERNFNARFLTSALLATAGAVTMRYQQINEQFIIGFLLVQASNLCFAIGQVSYKRIIARQTQDISQLAIFGWFYIGAALVAIVGYTIWGNHAMRPQTSTQWLILIYLGMIASGLGYFLWNKGATQVNIGTLAIANNLLVPAGIAVNLIIWNHNAPILRLASGAIIMIAALYINEKWPHQATLSRNP